jgi:GNAT superfamily N-acetyltransferase
MSFELQFENFPESDPCFQYANIPWDSHLFGMSFFEIRIESGTADRLAQVLPNFLSERLPRTESLIVTRISPLDVSLAVILARNDFYPVETQLEVNLPLHRFKHCPIPNTYQFRLAGQEDLGTIQAIAGTAFKFDRFHLDPHLSSEKADLRYVQWVEKGFNEPANLMYVFEEIETGLILGFCLLRKKSASVIELSLLATDPSYHGTGIGAMMDLAILNTCKELGFHSVTGHKSVNNRDVMVTPKYGAAFTHRNPMLTFHLYRPN